MANDLKLDIFPHIFPAEYFERMKKIAAGNPALAATIMRWLHIPVLWNLDARKTMMKQFKGYKQVLTLSLPAIEFLAGPQESPALAKLANDGMAEIVARSPDLFPVFVASLPMNNVQASLDEMDRAITRLGAKGIQVFTNVNGRPLDDPEFYPIFERCVKKYDLPIWLHPVRTSKFADYPTETKSKYEIWWLFGWPYETSACMARMAFSGMFKKLPNMKVITHHLGAMAPYFVERIALGMDQMGLRTHDEDYVSLRKNLGKRPVDIFKMFYGDTAINGSPSALQCGLDFFGADRVLFGTDCPFDPEGGPGFIRGTIKAMAKLDLPESVERKIYYENAFRILHMNLALSPGGKPAAKPRKK